MSKPEEGAYLLFGKHLAQQLHQMGGSVYAIFRGGSMSSLAVCQHLAAGVGGGYLKHPLGFGGLFLKLCHLFLRAGQDALRLERYSVGHGAGHKGAYHSGVIFGFYLEAHMALFAVANAIGSVGGKAHVRLLLVLEVIGYIVHADFFRRTENDPQFPVAFDTGIFQSTQTVQGHNGRALVVGNAPSVGVVIVDHHGVRIGVPALAGGDHVQMGHDHCIAVAFTVFRVGSVVSHIFCL